jgi:hypothetical protein
MSETVRNIGGIPPISGKVWNLSPQRRRDATPIRRRLTGGAKAVAGLAKDEGNMFGARHSMYFIER